MKKQVLMGAVVLVIGLALAAEALASVRDFARLVPEDTLLYADMLYNKRALKHLQASPGYKMMQDERVKAIMEEWYKMTDNLYEEAGIPMKEMGLSLRDTENFQEGGYAIAVGLGMQPVGNMMMPSPKMVILFDLSSEKMKKIWDKAGGVMDVLAKAGKVSLIERDIEGAKVRTYQLNPAGGLPPQMVAMVMPSFYDDGKIGIIGLTPDALAGCLKIINADGKGSLAENKLYKSTVAKLSKKRMSTLFFNMKAVISLMAAAPVPPKERKIIFETLGLGYIESLGMGSWSDKDGSHSEIFIHSPDLKCPLMHPFTCARSRFELTKGVSKYSASFMSMSFDAPDICELVKGIVKDIVGEKQFESNMKKLEKVEKKIGFSIEDDLLKSLGHEVLFANPSMALDIGGVPSVFPVVVAVEVKDRAKIEKIIAILTEKTGAEFARKEVGRVTVFYHPVAAYCFSGRYLIIGNSPTRVEQFLDTMAGKNLSIEKTDAYRTAMKSLKGKKSVLAYMSLEQTLRMISGLLFIAEHSEQFQMFGISPPFGASRREMPRRYPVPEDYEEDDMEDDEGWEPPDEEFEFRERRGGLEMYDGRKMLHLMARFIAIIPEYSTACYVAVVPDSDGLIIKIVIP